MNLNFDDVSKLRDVKKYLSEISEKSLLIYSPTSMLENSFIVANKNMELLDSHVITKNIEIIDSLLPTYKKFDIIITFGGGTVTDIGKYISSKLGKKLFCIPTMLSTNAYATDKVALITNGKKITLQAKLPDLILIDESIMNQAADFNVFGLADVLSIHTALYDWDLDNADNGVVKTDVYNVARDLLTRTVNYLLKYNYHEIKNNPREIFYFVGEAGYITNLFGSGKPESGSEHIFAKELESIIDLPHAVAVSIGIILISLFQENCDILIVNSIKKLKILESIYKYKITKPIIKDILLNLTPKVDRYSIVNKMDKSIDNVEYIINRFEDLTGVKFYADNKRFF